MFLSCMISTAARCSDVCGCGHGSLPAMSRSAASITAAPARGQVEGQWRAVSGPSLRTRRPTVEHRRHENVVAGAVNKGHVAHELHDAPRGVAFERIFVRRAATLGRIYEWTAGERAASRLTG